MHAEVRLEHPRKLDPLVPATHQRPSNPRAERRLDALVAVRLQHPRHKTTDQVDPPAREQKAQQAKRPEPAAARLDRHVDVRHRHADAHRLAVVLGDQRALRPQERLEIPGQFLELVMADRHRAPVLAPRLGVNLHEDFHLRLELGQVRRANRHLAVPRAGLGQALEVAHVQVGKRHLARQQILRLGQAGRLDQPPIVRRVPRREQRRRLVEILDQQPDLLVDGKARRAAHALEPLPAQPLRRRREQASGHRLVINALEEAEEANAVAVHLEVAVEPDRGDTPNRLASGVPCEEQRRVRVLKKRAARPIEPHHFITPNRRHPR